MPVGIMGDAAINTIQSFSFRNNINRHKNLNDNTSNKSLNDQGPRNQRVECGTWLLERDRQQGGHFVQTCRRYLQGRGF